MTQEELDLLMNSEDSLELSDQNDEASDSNKQTEAGIMDGVKAEDYKTSPDIVWPPPPPNQEHKVVHQLDDVTRDSEKKATEMIDRLEVINDFFSDSENLMDEIDKAFDKNIDIFSKLNQKFPNVTSFKDALKINTDIKSKSGEIAEKLSQGQDEVMMAMDVMQYQDIHRQKIERVINVMRALSHYMNSLFEGKIEDEKRVSSATYIAGDSNDSVVSNDDIEALISSLGQKK